MRQERLNAIPLEVANADASVNSNLDAVLDAWKDGFCTLLNPNSHEPSQDSPVNVADSAIDGASNASEGSELLNIDFSREEVMCAVNKAKRGKATGVDEIPVDVYKAAISYLHQLFSMCFDPGRIPNLWKRGIIQSILKSSTTNPRGPLQYRGILLQRIYFTVGC